MVEPRVLRPVLRFQLAVYQRAVPIPCDLKRLCARSTPLALADVAIGDGRHR